MKLYILQLSVCFLFLSCKTPEVSNPKVIGSESIAAVDGSFGSVIAVGTCSAVRIGTYFYLTAKHCIENNGWNEEDELDGRLTYKDGPQHVFLGPIAKIYEHPNQDVAIIKVMFEDPPVAIASFYDGSIKDKNNVIISGYGCTQLYISGGLSYPGTVPGYLQIVTTTLISSAQAVTEKVYNLDRFYYIKGQGEVFLGETSVKGPALCPGDSGGGLWIMDRDGKANLIGINNSIHMYTLISTFTNVNSGMIRNWIDTIIGE